jgi:NAD(P)H-nitrite reductase large subunit
MEQVVIIGNGIAGVTAARHIRKLTDKKITIISSETKYFFSRTALMYVYMGHMRFKDTQPYENDFWKKNKIDLIQDLVQSIDFPGKVLQLATGSLIEYDQLILSLGSVPNKFGWKGQDLKGVQGLYSKNDLDLMEENTRGITSAVIVGGGLIGIEMAEMLLSRNIKVDFLIREKRFWGNVLPKEDSEVVQHEIAKHPGITIHLEQELHEIVSNAEGRVDHVLTKKGGIISCEFVGLTAGVRPNVDFLKGTDLKINRGILVNDLLSTNIENVYAIGDCAEIIEPKVGRRAIEQVWYTGRMMGETVAQTIAGHPTPYSPGVWFNSAKFFDLEYQTYGWVGNVLEEGEEEFVWSDTKRERLLHFIVHKDSKAIKGVNAFGVRLRHEVVEHWIKEEVSIETVLQNLRSANFDPEFFKKFEQSIIDQYNKQFDTALRLNKLKWWEKVIS